MFFRPWILNRFTDALKFANSCINRRNTVFFIKKYMSALFPSYYPANYLPLDFYQACKKGYKILNKAS